MIAHVWVQRPEALITTLGPDWESGCAILILDQKVLKTKAILKKMQAQTGSTHGFYRSNLKFYELAQPVRW